MDRNQNSEEGRSYFGNIQSSATEGPKRFAHGELLIYDTDFRSKVEHGSGLYESNLWKSILNSTLEELWVFGCDAFANQLALSKQGIVLVNLDTQSLEPIALDQEIWFESEKLQDFPTVRNKVATDWISINGPVPSYMRLVPVIPLMVGGLISLDNLVLMPFTQSITYRCDFYSQIEDLKDGAQIRMEVGE